MQVVAIHKDQNSETVVRLMTASELERADADFKFDLENGNVWGVFQGSARPNELYYQDKDGIFGKVMPLEEYAKWDSETLSFKQ
jgi:hypothetical protein